MLSWTSRIIFVLALLVGFQANAQTAWTWTQKADMPFPISNNAVTYGEMGGNKYVYSFGGIDTTKIWSGINKRAFRYDVTNDVWDEIDTLPVVLPLIASSANTVNNKIYIIGGYHVYSNGNETSSDEVIIYNPETNVYEPNGAPVPVPIDDQVQCVWRDSLIFVITGWSNTGNVDDVQIYDPALDQWQAGTPVPNMSTYKAFGASGIIIGDTIYYHGGASQGWNFPAQPILRKGVINSSDPTQITWELLDNAPNANYRSACVSHDNDIFWIGGSATSYNYNGVAYNGSGGVSPSFAIARYEAYYNDWFEGAGSPYGVMDLRGAGQVSPTEWIICGGMDTAQTVSDRTFLLTYDPITGDLPNINQHAPAFKIVDDYIYFEQQVQNLRLVGLDGKIVQELTDYRIKSGLFGAYILEFDFEGQKFFKKLFIQ